MNRYDITTNWSRSFYERHPAVCEFLSMLFMLVAFTGILFLAVSQLDPYCMYEQCVF
jgi:hypothetical protein